MRVSSGSGEVAALVRVKPGDRAAPVVVHLVDWAAKPKQFEVRLDTKRFFGGKILKVKLLRPVVYNARAHAAAEKAAAGMRGRAVR